MTDTSATGEEPPPPLDGPEEGPPVGKAVALLIAFVVVTALLVGIVNRHPGTSSATTATTATTAPTTSTTTPGGTTTTTTTPPSKVPVLVANGSGAVNAATTFANQLSTAGWTMLPPVNATVSGLSTSNVYYVAPVFKPAAQSIATSLKLPATAVQPFTSSVPVADATGSGVVVVIGADLAPVSGSTTTTAAPATTTTAPHATTTTTKKK
jgi:LytR cell envelope-related transcriptional attenuator